MAARELTISVSHPDLPAPLTMRIDEGDGFENNAVALGWAAEVGPTGEQIEAAQLAILQAAAGSSERLAAQQALQTLLSTKVPNPVSCVVFLIRHVRGYIESILIDKDALEQQREAALEKLAADALAAVQSRVTVE